MKVVKKLTEFLLLSCFLLGIVSCQSDDENEGTVKSRRTVIIYMAAQNSLADKVKSDSTEIVEGAIDYMSSEDNIVMFIDDADFPRIYRIYKEQSGKSFIAPIYRYGYDANSADASILSDVLSRTKSCCPSESYGLVMWSHGNGWLPENVPNEGSQRSICIDVGSDGDMPSNTKADGTTGSQMNIKSMASAIQRSGIHFDYIFFDACNMQSLEVAWDLRETTNYMVACPTVTSSYGACYTDQIRNGFFAYPSDDNNIKRIADTYYYDVVDNPATKEHYGNSGCVISVIKMSALKDLAEATSVCLNIALKNPQILDLSKVVNGYHPYELSGYPDYFDPGVVFSKFVPSVEYNAWQSVLERCVIYKKASEKYYIGTKIRTDVFDTIDYEHCAFVSMFFPQNKYVMDVNYNTIIKDTDWYKTVWPKDNK